MKIVIKATNLRLTSALRHYIEEKIQGLNKFIQKGEAGDYAFEGGKPLFEAWVEVGKVTKHHHKGKIFRAECQLRLPQKTIRAEAVRNDIRVAIDEVRDELQRELKQYKDKQSSRYKKAARRVKNILRISFLARFRKR